MEVWVVGAHDGWTELMEEEIYLTEAKARKREAELKAENGASYYHVYCFAKKVIE